MNTNEWEFGTCRHCWKEIHRKYSIGYFRHTITDSSWCYEKKFVRRWKNTHAMKATETELVKRLLDEYEM
jgi:hypothetical protein